MEDVALTFPYTAFDLTDQVNVIPNLYGLAEELNLFPTEGSISTVIEIRYEDKVLRVLPARERGAPPTPQAAETGKTIFLEVPHFPSMDFIGPQDLQSILIQIGRTKRPITLEEEVAKRLFNIRRTHAITREWIRMTALQGLITDGNGVTIYNLYNTFQITPATVDFNFGTQNVDMNAKCAAVWQSITQNLKGETMNGIEAVVDPTFFERLIAYPSVNQFWLNAEQALQLANIVRRKREGQMWGREFLFGRILFREYYGTAPIKTGNPPALASVPFYPVNSGTAYPVGTQNMFRTYDAPAHDIRFVNTIGEEIYVSPKLLDHGKGVELLSESNCLAVCKRPEAIVQLTSST